MSLVQCALSTVRTKGAKSEAIPVQEGALRVTPKTITSSTTAAKPAITASAANIKAVLGGGAVDGVDASRVVWVVTNAGTDNIYVIIGKNLTAGSFNTGNAPDFGHLRGPGTYEFGVSSIDEEIVIIQAA